MWNVPSSKRLAKIPRLYETDGKEKKFHLHFFFGGSDWFICEYDGKDTFFGYTILNGDLENAEFGYLSFNELKEFKKNGMEIDCELAKYWKPKTVKNIPALKHLIKKRC